MGTAEFEQLPGLVLDRHIDQLELAIDAPYAEHFGREPRNVEFGLVGVARCREVGQRRPPVIARRTDDAPVAAGGDIAAGTRVGLLHVARREDLLLLDEDHAGPVAA